MSSDQKRGVDEPGSFRRGVSDLRNNVWLILMTAALSAVIGFFVAAGLGFAGDWWSSRETLGEIVSPRSDSLVGRQISVDATVSNVPADSQVWVFVGGVGDPSPQVQAAINRKEARQVLRFADVFIGAEGESGQWTVYLVVANRKAQLTITEYLAAVASGSEPSGLGFPDGTYVLDGVTIRRDAEQQSSGEAGAERSSDTNGSAGSTADAETVTAIAHPADGEEARLYAENQVWYIDVEGAASDPGPGRSLWLFSLNDAGTLFPQAPVDPAVDKRWVVSKVYAFALDSPSGATNTFLLVDVPSTVDDDLFSARFEPLDSGLPEGSFELDSVTVECCPGS